MLSTYAPYLPWEGSYHTLNVSSPLVFVVLLFAQILQSTSLGILTFGFVLGQINSLPYNVEPQHKKCG